MGILRTLLVAFLAVNALFWGLWPHSAHCGVAATLGIADCPSHMIHLAIGLVFFVLAVVVAQWGYFTYLAKSAS